MDNNDLLNPDVGREENQAVSREPDPSGGLIQNTYQQESGPGQNPYQAGEQGQYQNAYRQNSGPGSYQNPYQQPYQDFQKQAAYQNPYQQPYQNYQQQPFQAGGSVLEEPVSFADWMVTMLLMYIPCVNIIMMFVWAFGSNTNKSKSNYFKAVLVWMLIVAVLFVVMLVAFGAAWASVMSGDISIAPVH